MAVVDQLLGIVYALLGLVILISVLENTLALSILERTRELRLLRAVNKARGQLLSTIRWESVISAVQGVVLGVGIGAGLVGRVVTAPRDEGHHGVRRTGRHPGDGGAAGCVGWCRRLPPPCRRAARLQILQAIATG